MILLNLKSFFRCVFYAIVAACLFGYLLDVFYFENYYGNKSADWLKSLNFPTSDNTSGTLNLTHDQNVSDLNCRIPLTPIWPEYFKNLNSKESSLDCSYEENLIEIRDDMIQRLYHRENSTCCVQNVFRGKHDGDYRLTDCEPLRNNLTIANREVMLVKCDNYTNLEANIPWNKPETEKKMDFWKNISQDNRPYSVFIFGFDTVSRSHAFRSLPKTLAVMESMEFVDFKAYHSVVPSTLTNFMAILMGLSRSRVRQTCAKNWRTTFDNCPLIWKDFNKHNYLTGYMEDSEQSFNWNGQSGFRQQPTDYYIHPLFLALDKIRKNVPQGKSSLCTSRETVPQFMLRYSRKWLEKFKSIPSFFMTWFAYPFHQSIYALKSMDDYVTEFLMSMQEPEIMENSFIIFFSDHGDRSKFFRQRSVEAFFERGLPPLFIRVPNRFKNNYPAAVEIFKSNALKLTTPFDVHHTMLHILSLNPSQNQTSNETFQAITSDRASLFAELSPNRTCDNTNIPVANCLCNIQYGTTTSKTKMSTNQTAELLEFCVQKLNEKVNQSRYKDLCFPWEAYVHDMVYAQIIHEDQLGIEIWMNFKANTRLAQFEARIKVEGSLSNMESKELLGFVRNNRYGDQSFCVPNETDQDKEMKEFCICKAKQPK